MLPLPPSVEQVAHGRNTHAVFLRQVFDLFASRPASASFLNRGVRHLGLPVAFPNPDALTALGNLVAHIVGLGSKEQVFGIDASRSVAPVANVEIAVKPVVCKVERHAMGERTKVVREATVSPRVHRSGPEPATAIRVGLNVLCEAVRGVGNHRYSVSMIGAL